MKKQAPSFLLSPMSGGINRYEQEAGKLQSVDALDVIYQGDLTRRPAYKTIQISAPYLFPAGYATVATRNGGSGSYTDQSTRAFTVSSFNEFFIGCDEQFDGIDLRYITLSGFTAANLRKLEVSFSAGNNLWTTLSPSQFRDWTRYRQDNTAYSQPLSRDGRIAWHTSSFNTWQTGAFTNLASGATKYWIRLRILDISGSLASLATTVTLNSPGLRIFKLAPVTLIDYRRYRSGRESLMIGSDRTTKQTFEKGAMLGTPSWDGSPTEELILTEDEGPGVIGETTWPEWQQYVASVWTNQGAPSTTTYGTANVLTKNQTEGFYFDGQIGRTRPYKWLNDSSTPPQMQWKGAAILTGLTPTSAAAGSIQVSSLSVPDNFYQNCRLRVTAKGAGGSAVGEEREIYKLSTSGGTTTIYFYDAFTTTPDTNNRFAILAPNALFKTRRSTRIYEVLSNGDHTITPVTSRPFAPELESSIDDQPCNFEVGWPSRYSIEAGERWTSLYSPDTNELFLTNGKSGLLSYDGKRLRRVSADTTSNLANQLSGELLDRATNDKDPQPLAKAKLSTRIPSGKFLADWNGHIGMAGFDDNPTGFSYSAPGGANRIWPYLFNGQIRDGRNLPISGIGSLDGRAVIWTPASIHFGDFQETGQIIFSPLSANLGFINHHSVARVPYKGTNYLIGPNADGVYLTNGLNPITVLDKWDRIIKGGANTRALSKSVATVMTSESMYLLAFPSSGSDSNNRLALFDYERDAWWVWTLPYGASSISTIFDNKGFERLLIGTDTGHVMTLVNTERDDGEYEIDGYAVTRPYAPAGDLATSLTALIITARNPYKAEDESRGFQVSVKIDKRSSYNQEANLLTFDEGQANYTRGDLYGTATYSGKHLLTRRLNLKLGTEGHLFQVKVGGIGRWALRQISAEYRPKGRR